MSEASDALERRKADAAYALAQLRAKGLDALDDPRVRYALAKAHASLERLHSALHHPA